MRSVGFEPVSRSDARVLILGTLPGQESLQRQQYYAKTQNSFWRIMGALVGASPDLPYRDRLNRLTENGVALWDVCAAAEREGSLDSDIRCETPNDFASFFKAHREIGLICFNGQRAEKLFRRHIGRNAAQAVPPLPHVVLPSTSPARAGMRHEEKLLRWRAALQGHIACIA